MYKLTFQETKRELISRNSSSFAQDNFSSGQCVYIYIRFSSTLIATEKLLLNITITSHKKLQLVLLVFSLLYGLSAITSKISSRNTNYAL